MFGSASILRSTHLSVEPTTFTFAMTATDAAAVEAGDFFYISKKYFDICKAKLEKSEELAEDEVQNLCFPEGLADDETMIPVDMLGCGEEFDDVEQMKEKLGLKGTVEAFIKAHDHFEKNKDKIPEEDRPVPMSAKDWKEVLAAGPEGEEEELMEGDEEEMLDDDEEDGEEEEDDDAEAAEPAAKKAKTA